MMKRRGRGSRRVKRMSVDDTADRLKDRQNTHEETGRVSSEFCRLCHGKFSMRRLRQAFAQLQGDSRSVYPLFCTDFQQLLGIPINRDPTLSQYICNNCHAQFYKCRGILLDFRNRVNLTPRDKSHPAHSSAREDISLFTSSHITSDSRCLQGLVSWAHSHAEGCRSCPDLQELLEDQCRGSLKLMWGCVDGHTYVMDTSASLRASQQANPNHQSASGHDATPPRSQTVTEVQCCEKISVPVMARDDTDSELSDRNYLSEDEGCEDRRKSASSEESSDLHLDTSSSERNNSKEHKTLKPKARRKPGPKPGWKKNIKAEREELPTIYKCPHQGCTAVYRGADGMKKHIKEHHEEVRERPCPHPGCNKVFMIDRYLQRHVKLIHTEVRNYICDQCGQTFKQRKHLSVHQMRHSGAKPLQCEVCGFQCRQRASLKYHMTKHKAEADLEFACAMCGKRFEKAHNLNVHMSMVHPLMQGGSISIPPDSSASSLSTQQIDSNPSDMNYTLQSKLIDHTV